MRVLRSEGSLYGCAKIKALNPPADLSQKGELIRRQTEPVDLQVGEGFLLRNAEC